MDQFTLNTVCPYYTMFPLEYPLQVLGDAPRHSRVLDPFCGRGTTIYAARLRGLSAFGVDTNPVAVAIAQAKLAYATPEDVTELASRILAGHLPHDVPEGEFWSMCYNPYTLESICRLRAGLQDSTGDAAVILRAVLLGVLHGPLRRGPPSYLSNQMPRTFAAKPDYSVRYWRRTGLEVPPVVDVLDLVKRKATRVLTHLPEPVEGDVLNADARVLPFTGSFDFIVTSPPYFGMDTYRPDQWLRYWFLGFPPQVPYGDQAQVSRGGLDGYIRSLSSVWRRVGELAHTESRLYVRFGSIPSSPVDPEDLLRSSLILSEQPWRIHAVSETPPMQRRKRQSVQMGKRGTRNAISREIDVVATLG